LHLATCNEMILSVVYSIILKPVHDIMMCPSGLLYMSWCARFNCNSSVHCRVCCSLSRAGTGTFDMSVAGLHICCRYFVEREDRLLAW